jgi:hypothetical protein
MDLAFSYSFSGFLFNFMHALLKSNPLYYTCLDLAGMPLLLCAIAAMALQRYCHVPTLMLAHILSSVFELG